ncbi:Reverse transcriptase domain-containing protein [Aphis craccivora]|uniref:Reverse transcriptase domain-containing protein n=1 Tax=Aphis craccivora TaxID=307492 RepID=A0A6G0XZ44_APHCR|nr:Reverse transcriptase domain-containing protein [Aphis craccivora]
MHKIIESKTNENLTEDQFDFMKKRGTREVIIWLRIIIEKMFRINKSLFIAISDLEKVFNNVKWAKIFMIIEDIEVDYNDRKIIHSLYINEIAVIETEKYKNQVDSKTSKGVKQGYNLSPTLFNLYVEEALKEVRKKNI